MESSTIHGQQKTALYRHFNSDGELLYIGVALSPTYRLRQHLDVSHWAHQISQIEVCWFDNRPAALEAEREAIKKEKPLYNIRHKYKPPPPKNKRREESEEHLFKGLVTFRAGYLLSDAARELGITESRIKQYMQSGRIGFINIGTETRRRYLITGWQIIDFLDSLQPGEQ